MTSIPTGELNWWITFEAVGDNDNTTDVTRDTLIRWAMDIPWWDAADNTPLYRAALVDRSLDIAGNAIDFRAGRASAGGAAFSLQLTAEVTSIFRRLIHVHTTVLDAAIGHDDATIVLDNTGGIGIGHQNKIVYINREAIKLGSGGPSYANCDRGMYGTTPTPHRAQHKIYERLKVLNRRQITIGYTPESATSYADEVVFRRFQLEGKGHKMLLGMAFECDGWLAMLGSAPVLPRQWTGEYVSSATANDGYVSLVKFRPSLDPTADGQSLPMTFRRESGRTPAAANTDTFLVEIDGTIYNAIIHEIQRDASDSSVVVNYRVWVYLRTGTAYGARALEIDPADAHALTCREVFASDHTSSTNGAIPGAAATASLPLGGRNSNVLTTAMQCLTSTGHGSNGDFDAGVEFGLGIPSGAVDLAGIKSLRDRSSGLTAPRFFLGREEDQGKNLLDLLERDMRAAGLAFSDSTEGLLTIVGLEDSSLSSTDTITDGDILDSDDIGENFGTALTIDSVAFRWNRGGAGRTAPLTVTDDENTAERLGPDQGDSVDAGSWTDRSTVLSRSIAWLNRWRHELPAIPFVTGLGTNLHAGQGVNLTSELVTGVDTDAERSPKDGVTGSRCHVMRVGIPDLHAGKIEYTLLHTGVRYDNLGAIAGTLLVASEAGGVVTVTDNTFIPLDPETGVVTHPIWDHDTDAFEELDKVQLLDEFGTHKAYGVVGAVTDTTIAVAAFTAAVEDDYIVHRAWDDQTASQQGRFASLADDAGRLGGDDDPGFQYEIG